MRGGIHSVKKAGMTPVCPENLKIFINLTFFEFLLMLDQWTLPFSDMAW
jgi:hypothetical protein